MSCCKNRRNRSKETFNEIFGTIKKCVTGNPDREIERYLVCGIVWLDNGIAINTHQPHLLINKCKSTINGSFQALWYETASTGLDSSIELVNNFSFMKSNFSELRQWTVRQKMQMIYVDHIKKKVEKPKKSEFKLVDCVQDFMNKKVVKHIK